MKRSARHADKGHEPQRHKDDAIPRKKKPHISMSLLHIHSEVLKTKLYPYLQLSPLSNRVIFSLKS